MLTLAGMAVTSERAAAGETRLVARQRLGVPAYWSAGTPTGAAAFAQLAAASSTVDVVIVNGSASGPAEPYDAALATEIRRLAGRGVLVLGYVDTGYLGRAGATTTRVNPGSTAVADWQEQAVADARAWYRLYGRHGLGGIFFDQTLPDCGVQHEHVDAYGEITGRVWRRAPEALLAVNPGMTVQECYTEIADVIVMAENTLEAYRQWTPPDWVYDHPASTFWHLVHTAPTTREMAEAVALARCRHAGYVFVTDAVIDPVGGPWNVLPPLPYWTAEIAAVRAGRGRYHRHR
jgi:hypothetical protein